jgi:hypothetical protein
MNNYSLKTWDCFGRSRTRSNLPYRFAWILATRGGFSKAQVVDEWGIVCLEVKEWM